MMVSFRSQVSAPIELLIAVIILVASISMALSVLNNVQEQQCSSELKSQVQKLQLAMQDLALQSPPSSRQVQFAMPSCGGSSVDAVRFVYYNDPKYCRECAGQLGGCWKIDLASYTPPGRDSEEGTYKLQSEVLRKSSVCVDVAGDLQLFDEHESDPSGSECAELSSAPCPLRSPSGETLSCDSSVSGVPRDVYDASREENPSQWLTLGRNAGERVFKVTLRKTVYACQEVGECGAISVCAKPCTGGNC